MRNLFSTCTRFVLGIFSTLLLLLAGCSFPSSSAEVPPTAEPAGKTGTGESIQFFLTADKLPVHITHADGSGSDLQQGESTPFSVDDRISTGAGGLGKLLYSDRINVEILQKTELVLSKINEVTGGHIEAVLELGSGHVHIRTGESGKADVTLKTEDATITTLVDDTDFSVCYDPNPSTGLTCHPVTRGSIKVFGQDGSQVYDGPSGGYTFNGKSPQPPVCFHEQEYKDWLASMRNGEDVEPLGALVDRWYKEPCDSGMSTGMTMESPTQMPTEAQQYFTQEFNADVDLGKWPAFSWRNSGADAFLPQAVTPTTRDGYLIFDLEKPVTSTYVTYDPQDYSDAKISLSAHNGGQNTNSVSLVCRYSHEGWYEFRIGNDGLYSILTFMAMENRYYTLQSGGSTAIISGMGVNEYSATCNKNELSLTINGTQAAVVKENLHQLGPGKVGMGVSSYDILPILVEINWFKVEQP